MHSLRAVIFGFLVLALSSCKNSSERPDTYFDSLIVAQIKHLSDANPAITKLVRMDKKSDSATFHPNALQWKNELEIFRQLSLFERSSYRSAYHIEQNIKDEKSNLQIKQYTAREKVPIPKLKFYYYREYKKLRRIEAFYQQGNALYAANRHLILEFEEIKGIPVLSSYSMEGAEKMILGDSVKFSIQSRIIY